MFKARKYSQNFSAKKEHEKMFNLIAFLLKKKDLTLLYMKNMNQLSVFFDIFFNPLSPLIITVSTNKHVKKIY